MNVNRMKKRFLLLLLLIPALLGVQAQNVMQETRRELTSPDGAYRFTFYQRAVGEGNAQMYYTLTYKNRAVVEESKLGILIENQLFESALGIPNDTCHYWCENLRLTGTEHRKANETWKPVYGERATVRDCYNEMTLSFEKGEGDGALDGGYDKRKNYFMNIIVRAYNEGVAFRYHFSETTNGLFLHIIGEQTDFTMPEGTMAYYERWAQGPYELRPLQGWGKEESERPLTLKLPDGLSVTLLEAEMVDYARGKFRLSADKPSTLETSLYSSVDVISPYSTPWRVIMAAERPVDLIVLLRIPDASIGGDEGAQTERRAVRAHEIEPGDPGLQRSVDPVFHFRDLRDLPGVIIIFRKEYFPGVPGVQKLLRIFGRSFDQRLDV